jgi:hypothetical protein
MSDDQPYGETYTPEMDARIDELMTTLILPWAERHFGAVPDPNHLQLELLHPVLDYLAYALVQAVPADQLPPYTQAVGEALVQTFAAFVQRHDEERRAAS